MDEQRRKGAAAGNPLSKAAASNRSIWGKVRSGGWRVGVVGAGAGFRGLGMGAGD